MKIGNKIREIRQLKKLSQENIACDLGISQKAYSDIESDKTKLTLETLNQIAKIFEMKLEDILSFNSDKIFYQNNYDESKGYAYVENVYSENKEIINSLKEQYQKHIEDLKNEIAFLRKQLDKFTNS